MTSINYCENLFCLLTIMTWQTGCPIKQKPLNFTVPKMFISVTSFSKDVHGYTHRLDLDFYVLTHCFFVFSFILLYTSIYRYVRCIIALNMCIIAFNMYLCSRSNNKCLMCDIRATILYIIQSRSDFEPLTT